MTASPVPIPVGVEVRPGPRLLAHLDHGPSLARHLDDRGPLLTPTADELYDAALRVNLRGRGGAAFPFATKLAAVRESRVRPVVVVNLSEGEPASAKDHALALHRPHLVLDGALSAAAALRAREVHVILPGDRPAAAQSMRTALAQRTERIDTRVHVADPRFVAGQARAVLELMAGRTNLPVTAWQPEAISGHRGRPTLLSNAETWAQVGLLLSRGAHAYAALGTPTEPGTTLLTLGTPGEIPTVREAAYGERLRDLLPGGANGKMWGRPALLGGFHGTWVTWETLANARVSVGGLRSLGAALGAGVVLGAPEGVCPVAFTGRITAYLADQSARRCGPCLNGLPALAEALARVVLGAGGAERVVELADLVSGRGACAHPDGTSRMVRSMLAAFPAEVEAHSHGECLEHGLRSRRLRAVS